MLYLYLSYLFILADILKRHKFQKWSHLSFRGRVFSFTGGGLGAQFSPQISQAMRCSLEQWGTLRCFFLGWIKRNLKHSWNSSSASDTCIYIYFHIIYVTLMLICTLMHLGSLCQHLRELPALPTISSGDEHNLQGDDGEVSPAFGRSRAVLG